MFAVHAFKISLATRQPTCMYNKKCFWFGEGEDESAPKAYHGDLEDDVMTKLMILYSCIGV